MTPAHGQEAAEHPAPETAADAGAMSPDDIRSTMHAPVAALSAAHIRGVYLWAGSATVALHAAKYPDRAVDAPAHLHAHSAAAAEALAARGINWAFLSLNWGFPREIEGRHWAEFAQAAKRYHAAGLRVVGYVQASNCHAAGSHARRDWYAIAPDGRRIPYFRRRLMTCWNHPDWIAEVARHARRALALGGDGVFFDNLWMGATPWVLGGAPGGFAGCACMRCRAAFTDATGFPLPHRLEDDDASEAYLQWRADVVARRFAEWRDAARAEKPDALVLSNNCDVVLRDTRALFGIALRSLAPLQDALLVENVAMPRYDAARGDLVANALPLKAVRAVAGGKPVLGVTYEHGIGLDGPPAPARLRRALAETAAVGAAPVLKGSEYLDGEGRFTVITAPALRPALDGVAPLLRWIGDNPRLFEGTAPAPLVRVYYDVERMDVRWSGTAPATLGTALALIRAGIPFDFVTADGLGAAGDAPVLVPAGVAPPDAAGVHLIGLTPDDVQPARLGPGLLGRSDVRRLADAPLRALSRAYFGTAAVRRVVDASGITARFLRSPFFRCPPTAALVDRCGVAAVCSAQGPVLVERRRLADGALALHLVNYMDAPNEIRFEGAQPALHTPDTTTWLRTQQPGVVLTLDCYAVLEWPVAARSACAGRP